MAIFYKNGRINEGEFTSFNADLGPGVFETIRIRKTLTAEGSDLRVIGFHLHLKRLAVGIVEIGSEIFDLSATLHAIKDLIKNFDWQQTNNACLRLVFFKRDWFVQISNWTAGFDSESGIKVCDIESLRSVPEIKGTADRGVSLHARRTAEDRGYDEALLVDRDGIVREGAWSNFFWFDKHGILNTPSDKILNGVTRQVVLEIAGTFFQIRQQNNSLDTILHDADEAFITQATHGIVPVVMINKNYLATGTPGERTKVLIESYENLLFSPQFSTSLKQI